MLQQNEEKPPIHLIASDKNWIEGEAIRQLEKTAQLPGIRLAVGLPDIHPGKGSPVGAAFITEGIIYPHLIGNDIGCGMGLWQSDLKRNKLKRDKWEKKLGGLEQPWEGNAASLLAANGLPSTPADASLGTIGLGNHFAELQLIEKIVNPDEFAQLGLDKKRLVLMVHSGSRGVGNYWYRSHTDQHGPKGLSEDSEDAEAYLQGHNMALKWAKLNRELIARRFLRQLGSEANFIADMSHNSISPKEIGGKACWIHRKGAAPSDSRTILVPGSRGTLSYIVAPKGKQDINAFSVAHGAGRKWQRSESKGRVGKNITAKSLLQTKMGNKVICEDKNLLYEEVPAAYKNIEIVISDLVNAGLVTVVASLRPLITYKMRQKYGRK